MKLVSQKEPTVEEVTRPDQATWRILESGSIVPISRGYADQPYLVRCKDGSLLMVCTTAVGCEGSSGQHVVSVRSEDGGATWSEPAALEPPGGVESSYAVPLVTESGRIYVFYNHNTDNVRRVPADRDAYPDGWCRRVDSLGYFVFKYSDDGGRTWSADRYPIDVREFEIDRTNSSGGKIRYFWNVGRPFTLRGSAYIPLHKVGGFGHDFFTRSEGVLLVSPNLHSETDPQKIRFETFPDGDRGIQAPAGCGPIAEEHSFAVLSDGSLFTVFRTVCGHPACAYSGDAGRTWTIPDLLRYPDGRPVKNPRAANFIWKIAPGRFLYWFHNHSGRSYADRNPVWALAAREVRTSNGIRLEFSQPEVLFSTHDITRRMSYPDCMPLSDGSLIITETEKQTVRLHRVPAWWVSAVLGQWDEASNKVRPPKPILSWSRPEHRVPCVLGLPEFPVFYDREGSWEEISGKDLFGGMTLLLSIVCEPEHKEEVLFSNRTPTGRGLRVQLETDRRVSVALGDGRSDSHWTFSQPLTPGPHQLALTIDGAAKIVTLLVDGVFDDGGDHRQFGFGLFHPFLQSLNGEESGTIGESVGAIQIFPTQLLHCESAFLSASAAGTRFLPSLERVS